MSITAATPLLGNEAAPAGGAQQYLSTVPAESSDGPRPEGSQPGESSGRHLGLVDGIALVLGLQIGTGIFSSPSLVVQHVQSERVALLIWAFAGLLVWACAACYIELGTRVPRNGGPQEYLVHCFQKEFLGLLASWACIFVVKPCSAAILALVASEYICNALDLSRGPLEIVPKAIGLLFIVFITAINVSGNKQSNTTTKVLLTLKVLGVGFVIVRGLTATIWAVNFSSTGLADEGKSSRPTMGNYTDATLAAMWSYSGWETLAFVGGELQRPERNTALVINLSMATVITLSLLANFAYFSALSFADIVGSPTIGLTFANHFLGCTGGVIYTVMICTSSLGTLNVKTFTAGRLTQAAAERHFLPDILRTVGKSDVGESEGELERDTSRPRQGQLLVSPTRFGNGSVPVSAITFNSLLAAMFTIMGKFSTLITFIGIVDHLVACVTITGLLVLRLKPKKTPTTPRSSIFQVPLPLILVAMVASLTVVSVSFMQHPSNILGLIGLFATGAIFFNRTISGASQKPAAEGL